MARTTNKILRYYRAIDQDNQPFDLESRFRVARERLNTVALSEIKYTDEVLRIQHCRPDVGVSVHLVRYLPGEASNTLLPGSEEAEDHEGVHPPPEGMEYKDGDFFLYCHGHHVIACAHGLSMTQGKMTDYLRKFICQGHADDENPDGIEFYFTLSTALNLEKYRLIEKHGVKAVCFSASAYAVSYGEPEPDNWLSGIKAGMSKAIRDNLGRLDDDRELKIMEDLILEANVGLKGNTRADDGAQRSITSLALEAAEDDAITIITQNDEKITGSDIKLQAKASVNKHGKSVDYDQVWSRLIVYYGTLREQNLLEQ